MVYYGEEIGMPGQKGDAPYWDNYRREPMDWYTLETGPGQATWFMPEDRWNRPSDGISVEEQEADPGSLLNHYRAILSLRLNSPALLSGDFAVLDLEAERPGGWAFIRQNGTDWVLCVYNFTDEALAVTILAWPATDGVPLDLLTGTAFPEAQSGAPYTLTLPPASAVWLAPQP
jgi:glycosidase